MQPDKKHSPVNAGQDKQMKILFICKHNRFRSKVAEAYLKKLNKQVEVSSAGLIFGNPPSKKVIDAAKKEGINISGNPKPLSQKLLREQDIVVNVATNVPTHVLAGYGNYKLISWNIRDILSKNNFEKRLEKKIRAIMKKVEKLNKKI